MAVVGRKSLGKREWFAAPNGWTDPSEFVQVIIRPIDLYSENC